MSRLDLVIGPNGAGKSTFVEQVLHRQVPNSVFVNADLIAKDRWPGDPERHAYEAAAIADQTRKLLIARNRQFIAETVFSHPSKLQLLETATEAGYRVVVHILLIEEGTAIERVRQRVGDGGHSVPEIKIRARYRRLWPLVVTAAATAHAADFWDNGSLVGPTLVAELVDGELTGAPRWPNWTPPAIIERWPKVSDR